MDAVVIFAHSQRGDAELRYSLRSWAGAIPWVRKVWIFGDRPEWLSDDTGVIEHVQHEVLAKLGRWKLPLKNHFLMTFLASLIPGLSQEFLAFSDDYVLLEPATPDDLRRVRVLEDLSQVKSRGSGLFKEALWRTYDTLRRLGYGGLNFECHVPRYYRREWIWDAYCELQDFVTEDRYYGLLAATAIMNHAIKHHGVTDLVWLHDEGRRAGFYGKQPTIDEVRTASTGKTFLSFDDAAWGPGIEQFLAERLGEPSKFEKEWRGEIETRDGLMGLTPHARQEVIRQSSPRGENWQVGNLPHLAAAFARATSSRGQMTPAQYFRVVMELAGRGACKLLIVGAGRDTELYVRANAGGRTVVLERHARWIEHVRHLGCEVVQIEFSTRLSQPALAPCVLPLGLPDEIAGQTWDVILVDGPEGQQPDAPGRQQSIYLASKLIAEDGTVFLHDADRKAELAFAAQYLGEAVERLAGPPELAVFGGGGK